VLPGTVQFYIENVIYLCYKTSYLNEEVNRTEPSPSVSVPWIMRLFNAWLTYQLLRTKIDGYVIYLEIEPVSH